VSVEFLTECANGMFDFSKLFDEFRIIKGALPLGAGQLRKPGT